MFFGNILLVNFRQDDCGEWVTALCEYGDGGCPDTSGTYGVSMPEPMDDSSGSGYKVRVADAADESNMDCSAEFTLVASESDSDEDNTRHLYVTSPEEGDLAFAGEEYTVEVSQRWAFHGAIDGWMSLHSI